jgi:putative methyltransferase (TIGR04325 family)
MSVRGILVETLKLPPLQWVARRAYDRYFEHQRSGVHYRGIYPSHAAALDHAPASSQIGYDNSDAAAQYRHRVKRLRVSEYPALFWLTRLLAQGQRSFFDLGGHFGHLYYSFQNYCQFPDDLRWTVCDLPTTVAAGREWAQSHDAARRLDFTERSSDADGHDALLVFGTLQYLDYSLEDLLTGLPRPPRHIVINLTPMHPSLDFYTVQNMGFACVPYHILSMTKFLAAMRERGYEVVDRWESYERECRVPFESAHDVDCYSGFYLQRTDTASSAQPTFALQDGAAF